MNDEIKIPENEIDVKLKSFAKEIYEYLGSETYKRLLIVIKKHQTDVKPRYLRRFISKQYGINIELVKRLQGIIKNNNDNKLTELINQYDDEFNKSLKENKKLKVLRLPINNKYFEQIRSGKKVIDYRESKPYWKNRLVEKTTQEFKKFDLIEIKNGYSKNAPLIIAKYLATKHDKTPKDLKHIIKTDFCYSIQIGKIIYDSNNIK